MNQLFIVLLCVSISSCAQTGGGSSPENVPRTEERVLIRSAKDNKEVLIYSSRVPHDDDRIVVRLRCANKEVLALQSYQTVYSSKTRANESVRIHWRSDGNAVVVNLCVNGGTQETRPYYIVWNGCSASEGSYEPICPDNYIAEENVYFDGWDNSGKTILKVR